MNSKLLKKMGALCLGAAMTASSLTFAPSTVTAADSDNYAKLLQYALYFFDANMCGSDVESVGAMSWRGNCHTDDAVPGGFHDAGDHVMFGLPQGYTAMTLGWTYYEYKSDFDSLGLTAHFKKISKHFTEFFKKSVKMNGSNVSSILYQKGNGGADHAYWGPPESQGGGREMYWSDGGAADIAADYASALAFDYLNFGDADSLSLAKALYSYSCNSNRIDTPQATEFYKNSSCTDEQCFAAGVLYLATQEQNYLNDLKTKQTQYQGWIHGWENVNLGAACLLGEATGDWNAATGWMGGRANGSNYLFLDKWGSARLNCAFQTTAMIATKHGKANYADFCKGQMNYILGSNPANTCFVTGFASNSAKKPHYRANSGTSTANDNSDSKYTLIGALVGGPSDEGGTYQDSRADYVCNEVACDYNAALVGAAAGLYHHFKTGSVEKNIEGVKSVELGGGGNDTPSQPVTTTTVPQQTQPTTTKATTKTPDNPGSSTSDGAYSLKVGKTYNYDELPEDGRMFGFTYESLGIPASCTDKVKKVEVDISTSNGNIKTWVGAFGSSTTVEADGYWVMSDEMTKSISSNKGTLVWEPDSSTANIIQYGYGGEVKVGFWWIDCGTFTIDEVRVYTDGKGSSTVVTTTKAPVTTTKAPVTTTKTVTTTKKVTTTEGKVSVSMLGDVNCDGRVSIGDAIVLARYVGEESVSINAQGKANAELTEDNILGFDDVSEVLRIIARLR